GAVLVVHAPLLGVGEDGVRLVDLLEALLGPGVVGVTVGVVLGGQLAEGAPDLVLGRALRYPQDLVVVLVGCHGSPHGQGHGHGHGHARRHGRGRGQGRGHGPARRPRRAPQPASSSAKTVTRATRTRRSPCTKPASNTWSMVPGVAPSRSGPVVGASWWLGTTGSPGRPTSLTSRASRARSRPSLTAITPG